MNVLRVGGWALACCALFCAATAVSAAELPASLVSAPCTAAPTIDGVIDPQEWKAAEPITFDMPMVQLKGGALSKRTCQLRVMNSANALYLALSVPDATVNNSIAPIDLDMAIVAFCRGKEVAAGDDRKVLAEGIYIDKHVVSPGKDADDAQQDGAGAMRHADGFCTMEWAIPLDSGDKNDIQVKPGDKLRMNLAYIDGFRADTKGTVMGAARPGGLDHAAAWSVVQLAPNVADDGGTAFRGPAWAQKLLQDAGGPDRHLRVTGGSHLTGNPPVAKAAIEYRYVGIDGQPKTAFGKIYLPAIAADGKAKIPLFYWAGYELDDGGALGHARRGWAVATPARLEANPLVRTPNADLALLHSVRGLACIDDARVLVSGGSAGGYMTLMVAAETFPLAGAAPDVPPVNWGYNAAYFLQRRRERKAAFDAPGAPKLPVFEAVLPIADAAVPVYSNNPDDEIWHRHAPIAHLPTITCPITVCWSTADVLVPIDQVGRQWVRPPAPKAFPQGFTMEPERLCRSQDGRLRLSDHLRPEQYAVTVVPESRLKQLASAKGKPLPEFPFDKSKQWSILILDEGAPEAQVGHMKYPLGWSRTEFFRHVLSGPPAVEQLTLPKLRRLMDRYAGVEWLPTKLKHLDFPPAEKTDVLRGLRTYTAAGAEHANRLATLYSQLPPAQKVIDADVLQRLTKPTP